MDDKQLVHSIFSLRELPGEEAPRPLGRHTISDIRMREETGDVRLSCACGVSLRRKTNDRLAMAFSRHAGVLTFEEALTLREMEAAAL